MFTRQRSPCLLVDADPQGSLTLWHKLRGTNEPPIKTAVNSVSGICRRRQARRHRMGFHRHAAEHLGRRRRRHQERHHGDHSGAARRVRRQRGAGNHSDLPRGAQALCGRDQRRACANATAPRARIVTIAREALTKFRAPVWGGQITNRADLLMALSHGEGAREYYAEGRAAAEISQAVGARSNVRSRRSAERLRHRARCTSRRRNNAAFFSGLIFWTDKERAALRAFFFWLNLATTIERCGSSARFVRSLLAMTGERLTPPSACRTRSPATTSGSPTRCRATRGCPRS